MKKIISNKEILKIIEACNLLELNKLGKALNTFTQTELFETLFYLAIQKQEKGKEVYVASYVLCELQPQSNIILEQAIVLMLKEWDISIEEVVYYLVKEFGIDEVLGKINEIKESYRVDEEAYTRLKTIAYWADIYNKEYLVQTVESMEVPVEACSVCSPKVVYETGVDISAVYFTTEEDNYGRVSFENLDSIKVSRGEMLPLHYDWGKDSSGRWVFVVKNSQWLEERYEYEKRHYGDSYEFGGNVEEMKHDFSHYIFSFHDQFVEVIAKGLWVEESKESFYDKPLGEAHPLSRISSEKSFFFEAHGIKMEVRENMASSKELIENSNFCSQRILEFYVDKATDSPPPYSLILSHSRGKAVSSLRGYFTNEEAVFRNLATFEDVKPYVEKYLSEVAKRRLK